MLNTYFRLPKMSLFRRRQQQSGLTLLELIITLAILSVLVSLALPLSYNTVRRNKETQLRGALRELRSAIDRYRVFSERNRNAIPLGEQTMTNYPKSLEILAKGFAPANQPDSKKKIRFLRRIPVDPMTGEAEWGVRSSTDDPETTNSNGEDVFDVYSKSDATGLNGMKYREW
jgi:general secretion pathway protein G